MLDSDSPQSEEEEELPRDKDGVRSISSIASSDSEDSDDSDGLDRDVIQLADARKTVNWAQESIFQRLWQ